MLANTLGLPFSVATVTIVIALLLYWSVKIVDQSVLKGRLIVTTEMKVQLFRTALIVGISSLLLLPFNGLAIGITLAIAGIVVPLPMYHALLNKRWRGLALSHVVQVLNDIAVTSMRQAGDDGEYLIQSQFLLDELLRRKFKPNECKAAMIVMHEHFKSIGYIKWSNNEIYASVTKRGTPNGWWKADYVYCVERRHFKRHSTW